MQTTSIHSDAFKQPIKLRTKRIMRSTAAIIMLCSLLLSLLSACSSSNPQAQQQATQSRTDLEHTIQQATSIGVPQNMIKPVSNEEQTLTATNAPLGLFNEQIVTDYYQNLDKNYKTLNVQLQGVMQVTTEETQQTAQTDLQNLQQAVNSSQITDVPLDTFKQVYSQGTTEIKTAHDPKDFTAISTRVKDAQSALSKLPSTITKLQSFNQIITVLHNGHQDTTTLQKQYDGDKTLAAKAITLQSLTQLNQTIDTQNQQIAAQFNGLIPQLAQSIVDNLDTQIQQLKKYNIDTTAYQKKLDADRAQQPTVKTFQQYQDFSKQINTDLASMQTDLLKGQTAALIQQFHTEAINWGNANQYFDKYNNTSYPLDGGYLTKGIGEDLDNSYNADVTADDYQKTLTMAQNEMFHLQLNETDAKDTTPANQPHSTDMQLMSHYQLQNAPSVIVVSFVEEALRYYVNGKLAYSFLITAGRPELPPVPGLWPVQWRLSPTVFKSSYPKGSPYWYADTPIHYAMMYHSGGYFLHDSWWRNDYGPGTQFYHVDSSGNSSANYGSHGCVNMPLDQAGWLYNNTDYNTQILMY